MNKSLPHPPSANKGTNTVLFSALLAVAALTSSESALAVAIGACDVVLSDMQSHFHPPTGPYNTIGWTRVSVAVRCPDTVAGIEEVVLWPQAYWAQAPQYCHGTPYGFGFYTGSGQWCSTLERNHMRLMGVALNNRPGTPFNMTGTYNWADAAGVAPGRHSPRPSQNAAILGFKLWPDDQVGQIRWVNLLDRWGEATISRCSLTSRNVPVDFGSSASAGDEKPFSITYGSCANEADAERYNDAISLRFTSAQINPDGSLNNSNCGDCASGVRIAIQDSNGSPIPLTANYKLNTNPSRVIDAGGVRYEFLAQLQDKPGESKTAGRIDTQLVFETIME